MRFQNERRLLFLYDVVGAMRAPASLAHFSRVCAGSITGGTVGDQGPKPDKLPPSFRDGPKDQTRNLEIPGSPLRVAPE